MNRRNRGERLLGELGDEADNLRDHIASGHCQSMEDYRFAVGKLEALNSVHERLEEFLAADDEDNDDQTKRA